MTQPAAGLRGGGRPQRPATTVTVTATERLSPTMVRVHFTGDLVAFDKSLETDAYVKLVFPATDGEQARLRTYTVRDCDVAAGTLVIDFVVHGDEGLAGPWAVAATPGDVLTLRGPGGGYSPTADADWHLLVGDETAIPAIARALEAMPAGAHGHVLIEACSPESRLELPLPSGFTLTWVDAADPSEPSALVAAVRELDWPGGAPQIFAHGEGEAIMKQLRPYLKQERGVDTRGQSISAYWRRGGNEEAFREWKAQQREAAN